MSVDHLVCAAGEGARFRHLFGTLPKPLIRLRGATLLEWAIRSLPIAVGDRLVVVVQRRHGIRQRVATSLDATPAGPVVWIELDRPTRGQLETALTALEVLESTSRHADDERRRSLAIFNCDTFFESDTLAAAMRDPSLAGVLPCAQEPGDAWSFCAVDARDRVVRIAEKKRVGPWATAGFYFFRDRDRFLERAAEAVSAFERTPVAAGTAGATGPAGRELYVAPLYQRYLDAGETIAIDRVRTFKPMGTPEQIERSWGVSEEALKAENA